MTIYVSGPGGSGGGPVASPVTLTAHNATEKPLTINAAPGQSVDLLDIYDPSSTLVFGVGQNNINIGPNEGINIGSAGSVFLGGASSNGVVMSGAGAGIQFSYITPTQGAGPGTTNMTMETKGGGTGPANGTAAGWIPVQVNGAISYLPFFQ